METKESAQPAVEHHQGLEKAHETGNVDNGEVLETRFAGLSRWASVRTFWKAILFCLILSWAALNDGFQQQVPGNVIPMPAFVKDMADIVNANGEPAVSAKTVSLWQGLAEMTKTLGMFSGGWVADRIGRKYAMVASIVVLLAGSTAEITAHSWQTWLVGAMIIRLGVGLAQSILVVYISELAPHQVRGFMIGAYQLSLAVGQLISAVASQIVVTQRPTEWKPLIATEYLFSGVLAIIIWLVPESHLYYARKGQHEKAKKSMIALYGYADGYDVEYEYRVIQHGILAEQEFNGTESSFLEIFRGLNWRRTLAGCLGICSQWAAGAPIVFSYSTYFFAVAGLEDPFLVTIITFVLLLVSIFCALIACEHIGRRPLLIGGCALMLIFNVCLATTGFFKTKPSEKAALGFLLLWVICYGFSAGPIGFVASGETSTPRLRAQTTSFNLGCYGLGFVVFQWTISYMISPDAANLGVKAVYVWAALLLPTTVLLYFYYPETFGRTYWEIDELYERKIPAWKFKSTPTFAENSGLKRKAPAGAIGRAGGPLQESA
ncbi:general substrate transporter [Microdochium trichocladiopsis]|uniref:General substrate transporter n=1 Tax=Microdochium trichocladiopsis TaxID=1682393 RepID=A0A9P8Y2X9_9PEZI|nr:general substrate transporter [Microdochium trichocladiopsis]KAH7029489.1 general substrate transporter [Microdochium trichocladiopsis]